MSEFNRMPRSFNATPKPFNFQSTAQSPSFMKAVKSPNGAPVQADLSAPIQLNPEVQAMISEQSQPVFQPVAASQSTPQPVSVNVQTYNPCEPPTQVQRQATRAPTQNSTYQPPPVKAPSPPAAYKTHDLRNPEKSGVLRLPTVNFPKPQPMGPPMDKKTSALGNISSFMSKQPAVRRATGHPEFLQPLIDKEFPLGEPAVLEVRVGGPGPVTIQWYHNSQPVRESIEKDIRLLQKGPVYTLVYGELSASTLGRYTCQATNAKGSITCSCVLTEGGYDDDEDQYPTATYQHGPPMPHNPAYSQTVRSNQGGLPAKTKVVTKKPLNQLVTSGNALLYSENVLEEGLHSALGIQPEAGQAPGKSAVLDHIEGRHGNGPRQTSRTMALLAQQLDEDL